MPVLSRTLLLIAATGALCFADINIGFVNPNFPNKSSDGTPINGPISSYGIQDITFSNVGTLWTLTIDTNYGVNINGVSGGMTHFCDPNIPVPVGGCIAPNEYYMSDFLIQQGNKFYGVVLSDHDTSRPLYSDSYVAGNLYSASGFVNGIVGGGPVILAPGGTKLNTGSGVEHAVANPGANGTTIAEFKITTTFVAPVDFFDPNGVYQIWASSADCYNEFIHATVPEPSFTWMVPAILLVGGYLRRRSLGRVK